MGKFLFIFLISASATVGQQLDTSCTVSVFNRTAKVQPDGFYEIFNISTGFGPAKVCRMIVDGCLASKDRLTVDYADGAFVFRTAPRSKAEEGGAAKGRGRKVEPPSEDGIDVEDAAFTEVDLKEQLPAVATERAGPTGPALILAIQFAEVGFTLEAMG
ncbi:MAG: hypothetical protein ABIW76_03580 [Fibrobacteria bacterium]